MAGVGGQSSLTIPVMVGAIRSLMTLGLVLLLAFLVARFIWISQGGPQSLMTSPPMQGATSAHTYTQIDTTILLSSTPFRSVAPIPAMETIVEEETPETELNLVLNGVRTDGDGEGVAFVTGENGQQRRYYRGDAVDGVSGVTIDRIYADGVILTRNGRVEKLTTKDQMGDRAIRPADESDLLSRENGGARQVNTQSSGDTEPATEARKSQTVEAVQQSSQIHSHSAQLSRSEMLSFMQWARFDPQTQGNVPGVTVFPTNSAIFKKSGLRSRDIIQNIAGVKMEAGVDYALLLQDIEAEEKIELRLLRNGAPVELTIRMISE